MGETIFVVVSMRFRDVQVLFNFRIIGWEGKKRFL